MSIQRIVKESEIIAGNAVDVFFLEKTSTQRIRITKSEIGAQIKSLQDEIVRLQAMLVEMK